MAWIPKLATTLQECIQYGKVLTTLYEAIYANNGAYVVVAGYGLTSLIRTSQGTTTFVELPKGSV